MHYKIGTPNPSIQSPENSHYATATTVGEMLDEKEIKTSVKNASLLNTLADLQGPTFVILNNHTSAHVKKNMFI